MSADQDIRPYTNELARCMFVATADENYIVARWAFLRGLYIDFFWLASHAVEKYFKAILLLNGHSARRYGHDIERLHRAVRRFDSRLVFGPLARPSFMQDLEPDVWRDEAVDAFIARMNEMGDPNNRYMLYGYVVSTTDLYKLDQLIWSIRRHCRPLETQTPRADIGRAITIDPVDQLNRNRGLWHLSGMLPLEKALGQRADGDLRATLIAFNEPFAPSASHVLSQYRNASANPPLADWFERLRSQQARPETRATANKTLSWVLQNVDLMKKDRDTLTNALAAYAGAAPRDPFWARLWRFARKVVPIGKTCR